MPGTPRNFRRLVPAAKQAWRREHHRGRRPAVWSPGEHLVIDWGAEGGLHVFCAVLAWCRVRFVRFARDERAETTLALLAECFEVLGGVPGKVLADRMGCLKGGVVANVVVPTAAYVRFAGHYGFRPDFCEASDPESNAYAERFVLTARTEVTDRMLVFRERHLQTILAEYETHYNGRRPHRSRHLRPPRPDHPVADLSRKRIERSSRRQHGASASAQVGPPSGVHSVLPGIAPRVAPGICHARAGQLTHGGPDVLTRAHKGSQG
jgi:transposase